VAPAASAKSYAVVAPASSVSLADGRVVWLEPRGDGAELVAAGEDALPHDVFALRPVPGATHVLDVEAGGGAPIRPPAPGAPGPCATRPARGWWPGSAGASTSPPARPARSRRPTATSRSTAACCPGKPAIRPGAPSSISRTGRGVRSTGTCSTRPGATWRSTT